MSTNRLSDLPLTDLYHIWRNECRHYRSFLRKKKEAFYRSKLHSNRFSPRQMWQTFDQLLGRGRAPLSPSLSAAVFHDLFEFKTASIYSSSDSAPPPSFSAAPIECSFPEFQAVNMNTVAKTIQNLPNKFSDNDVIPAKLLKDCPCLIPFLTELFNASLSSGSFPSCWKKAVVTPVPKKGKRDLLEPSSYRPVSGLPVLSKLLERLVVKQIRQHLANFKLLPSEQSAYRSSHSTETALLKVTNDILCNMDNGRPTLLSSLDLSSAFDTVHHPTLLGRLKTSFGFTNTALSWITSYLQDRSQSVRYNGTISSSTHAFCGVPQGSVLGPLLFISYTSDLIPIVKSHGLNIHVFADDVMIYGSCTPSSVKLLSDKLSTCLDSIISWLNSNRLQLNASKTQFIWCSSSRRRKSRPSDPIRIGNASVLPSSSITCLGVPIDCELSFTQHVSKTTSACFSTLRSLRSICRCVPRPLFISLVESLVLSRLTYCISLLYGCPLSLLRRLQAILHASARLVFLCNSFSHVTPLLRQLQWLSVVQRIDFRLAALAHACCHGDCPDYLTDVLHLTSEVSGRQGLRSANVSSLVLPLLRPPTLGGRSFSMAAARTWNSIPRELTSINCARSFKKAMKSYFMESKN